MLSIPAFLILDRRRVRHRARQGTRLLPLPGLDREPRQRHRLGDPRHLVAAAHRRRLHPVLRSHPRRHAEREEPDAWVVLFFGVDLATTCSTAPATASTSCGRRTRCTTRARSTTCRWRCARAGSGPISAGCSTCRWRSRLPAGDVLVTHTLDTLYQFWIHTARSAAWARSSGPQHAVAPPRAPRRQPALHRQELRRHPDHLGPDVRHLRARRRRAGLRRGQAAGQLQPAARQPRRVGQPGAHAPPPPVAGAIASSCGSRRPSGGRPIWAGR